MTKKNLRKTNATSYLTSRELKIPAMATVRSLA
ncbi:hypothetical protein FOQG_07373 [Fusarium oxysporum f. sp. raphani 54005]|uniref:Uncharacterized protein n=4 Tax=Fusarium oxysporum TaxID=5507 RepID=X0CGD0_FUSOX|nr:hypothetical protein FOVG_01211 [Fusarium oxysporum f. sp. pisi HDV247]EXK89894.1 hypothetical protein FOQG_07373 [Fusarium oxysporum f. sp. raphani 54005]EXL83542.1 hypothetical protein FOPG_03683 [Fusarium oxysporum f. sp. conglutinans race 2 54008]EXM28238.1 hypothetical protein FOTG_05623 [Fusarium oxysporum f. sp. vasinfectum 25433]